MALGNLSDCSPLGPAVLSGYLRRGGGARARAQRHAARQKTAAGRPRSTPGAITTPGLRRGTHAPR
eukprot:11193867-Lingulodinium_polyedra.AAC.1